jgi:ABC-type uncharacterized transport system permease subunit
LGKKVVTGPAQRVRDAARWEVYEMGLILILAAALLVGLTLASVYSALVLAHRTDEIVSGVCDDSPFGPNLRPGTV